MRKSIFEIENRLNIVEEFKKILTILYEEKTIYYNYEDLNLMTFLNKYVFSNWKYRDTFIELSDYMRNIGITSSVETGNEELTEEKFLNFLELLLNLYLTITRQFDMEKIFYYSEKVKNTIPHNIPIILEKMNYEAVYCKDKVILRKRDADVDSVLDIVPINIAELLLSYNDIRNNNIESKKTILKKIDLYIDSNKRKYKSISADLLNSIDIIINKMGINHIEDKEPFNKFSNDELCAWYDKCFRMIIHLIRMEEISKISNETKLLISQK